MKRNTFLKLIISTSVVIMLSTAPAVAFAKQPADTIKYSIQKGDTLYLLASRFGTTVNNISSMNKKLDPGNLLVGQKITIPIGKDIIVHPIKWGDVLWRIAKNYNSTIETIAVQNNIKNPDMIYAGGILAIPKDKKIVFLNIYWGNASEEEYDGAYSFYISKTEAELDKIIRDGEAFLAQTRDYGLDDEGNRVIMSRGDSEFGQDGTGQWRIIIRGHSMAMGMPHIYPFFSGEINFTRPGYTNDIPVYANKFAKAVYANKLSFALKWGSTG